MDEKRERSRVMVKPSLMFALLAVTALVCDVHSENITSISQCMNTNLTEDILAEFPTNATASAQNCVLTFVKGSVNGNLKTFASPFSDEICTSEFGFSDLNNIPVSIRNEFSALMAPISNCTSKVISYSEIASNGLIKVDIALHRQGENYSRAEVAHLDIAQTNILWRIINWDVDE